MGLTRLHDFNGSWHLYVCRSLLGLSTFLSLHSRLWWALRIVLWGEIRAVRSWYAKFKSSWSYICMISAVICITLINSKRSLMSFWTKESSSLSQPESVKSMMRNERLCPRGAAQSTIRGLFPPWYNPLWCPPRSTKKKVRGGGRGEWSKWKLRIEKCVFATANSQLANVNYGFWIAIYGNGFCT